MLSGSRGDSTSVTKYPYVSPLPEAPSRLECYWYVDVSSRTETIGVLPSRALCLQRTLLIHFPFLSPFFFPAAYVYVCPADYRKRGYAAVCLLYPAATVAKYRSTWVTLEYPLPSCLSVSLSLSLLFSLPHRLLISSPASSYARTSPMPRASCIPEGRRDLLRLMPILETLPLRVRLSYVLPPFSFLLEPLSPFFACLRITRLISILLSFFTYSLGISFRHIGRKRTFPICFCE